MSEPRFQRPATVVVKVGSSSLRGEDGLLDRELVRSLADQLASVRAQGIRVVVVSSGAVSAGMGALKLEQRPTDLPTLQATAAVGQGALVNEYSRQLAAHDIAAAQLLLTQDDFVRRSRYLNARTTMRRLLDLGALPIVNENDAVATDELVFGDNDHLAALVTTMVDADLLLILSDVAGLHDRDPRGDDAAQLTDRVDDVTSLDLGRLGGRGSFVGSGGMRTKVESARVAVFTGAHAVVADARRPGVVADVVDGKQVGTWFVAQERTIEARRLWIGFALSARGQVQVDAGAAAALTDGGKSLLAVGVTQADGEFGVGDAVEVTNRDGAVLARGLTNFDANDVRRIAGLTTAAAAEQFGPAYAREVIHRDDLVIM